jgi:hypothetical protein
VPFVKSAQGFSTLEALKVLRETEAKQRWRRWLLSTIGAGIFAFFSAAQDNDGLLNIREWIT